MKTLKAVSAAIETLTTDGHLPEPGTVVVSPGGATIMPELPGAPISGLLVWALHLDGGVEYTAETLFRRAPEAVTAVKARGKIDGIDIDIVATTYRPMMKLRDYADLTKVSVTEMELRELASDEEVLGRLT